MEIVRRATYSGIHKDWKRFFGTRLHRRLKADATCPSRRTATIVAYKKISIRMCFQFRNTRPRNHSTPKDIE
jgi:hypothetical protein